MFGSSIANRFLNFIFCIFSPPCSASHFVAFVLVQKFRIEILTKAWSLFSAMLLPLRRKACCGFFRPKNPTASAGLEPANLGTKRQHANYTLYKVSIHKTQRGCHT